MRPNPHRCHPSRRIGGHTHGARAPQQGRTGHLWNGRHRSDSVTTLQLDTVYDCGDGYDPSNLFLGLAGSNCESGKPASNTRTTRGQHAPFSPPYCIASKKRLLAFRSQGPPSPPPHHRQIPVAWAHHGNAVALPCRTRALADSAVNPNIGGDDEWMALVSHAHSLNITVTSFWNAA